MKTIYIIMIVMIFSLSGCSGPNPNPGERTTDIAWNNSDFQHAYEIAKPRAEAGEPWAQLRMGIFYANGWGIEVNLDKAEYWYKKALAQKTNGKWAEGFIVGATGKSGYFNQNSDARIAEYNLANLYLNNNKNLEQALQHINNVIKESNGNSIFFCCEFSSGRSFTQKQFIELKNKIENKLNSK